MKKLLVYLLLLFVNIGFAQKCPPLGNNENLLVSIQNTPEGKAMLEATSSNLFTENKGQVKGFDGENHPEVKFALNDKGMSVFLLETGIVYQFNKVNYPKGYEHPDKTMLLEKKEEMNKLQKQIRTETYRMDMHLTGANKNAKITKDGESADYINYYTTNTMDVRNYAKVTYHDIYPNIDWVIYKNEKGMKYDFVVHPGGDPSQIKMEITNAENVKINEDGSFTLTNQMGSVTENAPISFQEKQEIKTKFILKNNCISFLVEKYNTNATLIVDPALTLQWLINYGGTNDDYGNSCTVDNNGNVYLAGSTGSTDNIASGGHQNYYGGLYSDAYLVKFNSAGVRQWGTYYGGSNYDWGNSCVVDNNGNVYLAGQTESVTNIASGGHQNTFGGYYDAFLVKFNTSGIRLWATYYGGMNNDAGQSCIIDTNGNVILAGFTASSNNIAAGGYQNTFGGDYDAFLVKFNSSGVRLWSTYYGGSGYDKGYSSTVDASGNVYLTGQTSSTTNIAYGGHQNIYGGGNGNYDAFLAKFNSSGVRQWATYYGGNKIDQGYSCVVDKTGNVYLAGASTSTNNISSNGHQNAIGGFNSDAFLAKFNSSGVRLWGTYYGGSDNDFGYSSAIDECGNVFLAGETGSTSNIALDGYQNIMFGLGDAFLVKFDSTGFRQWGTYCGGNKHDVSHSFSLDNQGNMYLVGETYDFKWNAFLVKFNTMATITTNSNQGTSICAGQSVIFSTNISNGGNNPSYQWKKNGNNVGTNLSSYTTATLVTGDIITCELTSNAVCGNLKVISTPITMIVNPVLIPTISISSQGSNICYGQSVTFNSTIVNGGISPIYHWRKNGNSIGTNSPSYTIPSLANGDVITCKLTSNAVCANPIESISNSITILVNPLPIVSIVQNPTNLIATPGYAAYKWSLNGNLIPGATNSMYSPTQNGVYSVGVTDNNGCKNSTTYNFNGVGIEEIKQAQFVFYPNPSNGQFTITSEFIGANTILVIYNTLGKEVYQQKIAHSTEIVNTELSNGIYLLRILTDKGIQAQKIIVNK